MPVAHWSVVPVEQWPTPGAAGSTGSALPTPADLCLPFIKGQIQSLFFNFVSNAFASPHDMFWDCVCGNEQSCVLGN